MYSERSLSRHSCAVILLSFSKIFLFVCQNFIFVLSTQGVLEICIWMPKLFCTEIPRSANWLAFQKLCIFMHVLQNLVYKFGMNLQPQLRNYDLPWLIIFYTACTLVHTWATFCRHIMSRLDVIIPRNINSYNFILYNGTKFQME